MKLLITGPLGHIGSKLIHDSSFVDQFEIIYLVDNFLTQRYSTLLNLNQDKFIFFELDARNKKLSNIISSVDTILHLSAITNATETIGQRDKVLENNFNSTENVANLCLEHNKHLIYISSTSVYGMADSVVDENTTNLVPQTPYAESKLLEEDYIKNLVDKGLKAHILRFGTIYGTSIGMRFHTAVNKFCFDAILNKRINIWKNAFEHRRPYLYLGDAVQAIGMAITQKIPANDLYNVVTENLTVKEVIENISKYINKLDINFVDDVILNQHSYEVDFSKISKFGYFPKGEISRGVSEILTNLNGLVNYQIEDTKLINRN